MKDYTKYNFAAIVGAEVEIKTSIDNSIIKGIVRSHRMGYCPFIEGENGDVYTPICIKSLTAKIKVEDMSVKQLKRLIKTYQDPVSEHAFVITEDGVYHSILTALKEIGKQDFTDYIDCTDWGWKE